MDKNRRSFLFFSTAVIFLFVLAAIVLSLIYFFSSLYVFRGILLILILATIITAAVFLPAILAVGHAYKTGRINRSCLWLVRLGLKAILPFVLFVAGFFRHDRDDIRRYYVEVNNIYVRSVARTYEAADILVLLPHCLQDSDCGYKIAGRAENCRRCGKCCIGDISRIAEDTGVNLMVVTGGTAARNAVKKSNPKMILSVACERDLMIGIADTRNIPAIGIINQRPNGPCFNTRVDMDEFKERLNEILSENSEQEV